MVVRIRIAKKQPVIDRSKSRRELVRWARKIARQYGVGKLLSDETANTKFAKTRGTKIRVMGLSLSQHKTSGVANLCAFATEGCINPCVGNQGLARIWTNIQRARANKTRMLVEQPVAFRVLLWWEIDQARTKAWEDGVILGVRLNTFSDLPWIETDRREIETRKDVRFYDYTKGLRRFQRWLAGEGPRNYHLTFSRSEKTSNDDLRAIIDAGGTVAVPFRIRRSKPLPTSWLGIPVIDGDNSDFRPKDPRGVIVGLRAKGTAWRDASGFVVDVIGGVK